MKAQPLKELNRTEVALILDAMKRYMFKVGGASARMILSDYVKVLSRGTEASLDGMGMEHIYRSLVDKAQAIEVDSVQSEVMDLAQLIQSKKIEFQQNFYRMYIKKEAPTAGTVSASMNI